MRRRFLNPIDLCLILMLVFSILGICLRHRALHSTDEDVLQTAEIVLLMRNVDAETADMLTVGEPFYNAGGEQFGTLRQLSSVPAKVCLEENGTLYEGRWEDGSRVDVTLTVEVEGTDRTSGFLISGRTAVLKGQTIECYSDRAYVRALVREIRRIERENGKKEPL